jgi:hypothetical protein
MSEQDSINFSDLYAKYQKEAEVLVLPVGTHTLKVTGCNPKGKGVLPIYTPVDGPDAGKRVMCGVMSPGDSDAGRVAFMQRLVKFGLTKEFFAQSPTLKDISAALVGRVIEGAITIEPWEGEPRNKLGFGIKLVSAPALPSVGGVPNVQAAAAAPAPSLTPPNVAASQPTLTNDPGF